MSLNRISKPFAKILVPVALSALPACGGSDHAAASGHEPGDAGDSGKVIPGLSLKWRIVESGALGAAQDAGSGKTPSAAGLPGIPGVQVCVDQHPEFPCATSESDGKFTLFGLPATTDLVLLTSKTGYIKTLRAIETASTPMDNINAPLVTTKTSAAAADVGVTVDDTKGALSFVAFSARADGTVFLPLGVSVKLSPATADGPFFTRPDNTFDKKATSTVGGVGVFLNVTPGDYGLTFEDPALDCAPVSFPFSAFGFPVLPSTEKFPIRAGYVTDQIAALCTQKSILVSDGGAAPSDASSPRD